MATAKITHTDPNVFLRRLGTLRAGAQRAPFADAEQLGEGAQEWGSLEGEAEAPHGPDSQGRE